MIPGPHNNQRDNEPPLPTKLSPIEIIVALTPILVSLLRFDFSSSFWLDETLSAWLASLPFPDLFGNAVTYQGQSPLYYALLRTALLFVDVPSEPLFRAISVAFGIGSLFLVFLLGRKISNPRVGLVATLIVGGTVPWLQASFSARPYAPALFFSLLALLSFISWMEYSSRKQLGFFVASYLLSFYFHYLYAATLVLPLLYFIVFKRDKNYGAIIFALLLPLPGILPGFFQLYTLFERSSSLEIAPSPSLINLFSLLFPPFLTLSALLTLVVGWLFVPKLKEPGLQFSRDKLFTLSWWLIPPILFTVVALFGGPNLTLRRYLSWYLVGFALTVALVLDSLHGKTAKRVALVCLSLFFLVGSVERSWKKEDWRSASQWVKTHCQKFPDRQFLLSSGLVESNDPEFVVLPKHLPYLLAPVGVYADVSCKVIPIPSEQDALLAMLKELPLQEDFGVITLDTPTGMGSGSTEILDTVLRDKYYDVVSVERFGLVSVMVYRKAFREEEREG